MGGPLASALPEDILAEATLAGAPEMAEKLVSLNADLSALLLCRLTLHPDR